MANKQNKKKCLSHKGDANQHPRLPQSERLSSKRRNSNGQKTHEKMLTISSNKGNAN
jgi:hypothetical protein